MAVTAAAGLPMVGVAVLAVHGAAAAAWFASAPVWQAVAVVVTAGAVLCGAALLPTHAVSLAAGWLLGAVAGPAVAWAAVMLATVSGYAAGRLVSGPGWVEAIRRSPHWSAVYAALVTAAPGRTTALVALLRLSPLAPFAATNVALAGLGVGLRPYTLGAAVGLAPRVLFVAWLGAGMATLDWSSPRAPGLLVAGVIATVLALVLTARVASAALRRAAGATAVVPDAAPGG